MSGFTNGGSFQEAKHGRRAEAGVGQIEEAEERIDDLALASCAAIRDVERDGARVGFGRTEDGLHERRVGLDVGRHHHDVARCE